MTTSVAYNGVNLIDPDLHHIVVDAATRTQLVQMLGRKRLKKGEKVNAWVVDMPREKIARRYHQILNLLTWYDRYAPPGTDSNRKMAARIWEENDSSLKNLFDFGNDGSLYKNTYAEFELKRRAHFLNELLLSKREHPFQDAVRGWLGLTPEPESDRTEALNEFYFKHPGTPLNEAEQNELRKIIQGIAEASGVSIRSDRKEQMSVAALNGVLEKIGCSFILLSSWRIRRLQEEDTEAAG